MKLSDSLMVLKFVNFDNTKCIRKLPFSGKSYYIFHSRHLSRIEKFIDYIVKKEYATYRDCVFLHLNSLNPKSIKVVKFSEANDYVIGNTEKLPELFDLDTKNHLPEWKPNELLDLGFSKYEIEINGGLVYTPKFNYHIIVK
jgi:hypothetical protein